MADTVELVLKIPFLNFSNAKIRFIEVLVGWTYTTIDNQAGRTF